MAVEEAFWRRAEEFLSFARRTLDGQFDMLAELRFYFDYKRRALFRLLYYWLRRERRRRLIRQLRATRRLPPWEREERRIALLTEVMAVARLPQTRRYAEEILAETEALLEIEELMARALAEVPRALPRSVPDAFAELSDLRDYLSSLKEREWEFLTDLARSLRALGRPEWAARVERYLPDVDLARRALRERWRLLAEAYSVAIVRPLDIGVEDETGLDIMYNPIEERYWVVDPGTGAIVRREDYLAVIWVGSIVSGPPLTDERRERGEVEEGAHEPTWVEIRAITLVEKMGPEEVKRVEDELEAAVMTISRREFGALSRFVIKIGVAYDGASVLERIAVTGMAYGELMRSVAEPGGRYYRPHFRDEETLPPEMPPRVRYEVEIRGVRLEVPRHPVGPALTALRWLFYRYDPERREWVRRDRPVLYPIAIVIFERRGYYIRWRTYVFRANLETLEYAPITTIYQGTLLAWLERQAGGGA